MPFKYTYICIKGSPEWGELNPSYVIVSKTYVFLICFPAERALWHLAFLSGDDLDDLLARAREVGQA